MKDRLKKIMDAVLVIVFSSIIGSSMYLFADYKSDKAINQSMELLQDSEINKVSESIKDITKSIYLLSASIDSSKAHDAARYRKMESSIKNLTYVMTIGDKEIKRKLDLLNTTFVFATKQ